MKTQRYFKIFTTADQVALIREELRFAHLPAPVMTSHVGMGLHQMWFMNQQSLDFARNLNKA